MSKTTIPDRDSSRADLIGPRVALLATHPAALHRLTLGSHPRKNQWGVRAVGCLPQSTFPLQDVLQRIQSPSDAIAHMSLRFLERLDAGLGTFELEP